MISNIQIAIYWITESLCSGNKILIAGNGGSAADVQHLAAEFIGRYRKERRKKSCKTVGLFGNNGGVLGEIVDLPVIIESKNTDRIQEAHITIGHIICEIVENTLIRSNDET